ncbi:heterokaryon incompatibility protein-domain-containing protein [Daedaleopsis nitida]|nr:heterokaryon incompatibility protein-domain-containing protein [Daedaleopsis nitida]
MVPSHPMWLLNTARAELHPFTSPKAVRPKYAILSHVWDVEEQSFADVRRINRRCKLLRLNSRNHVSAKIRKCCLLAERQGYRWLWIDTCCIDKSSSAELSEAIISMYKYYSLAAVCYAYLRDVPGSRPDLTPPPGFFHSKWHQRGWTLQELLAPAVVLFVSATWVVLGSKADFAEELEAITAIPAAVLRLETPMSRYSIAQRMSWAAGRETKREEDIAYCLLGIFDINMPPLYGEGTRAFRRLQEEILKRHSDTTLFAWGQQARTPYDHWALCKNYDGTRVITGIFATSPAAFRDCDNIEYTPPPQDSVSVLHPPEYQIVENSKRIMSFSVTPHGVQAYVPIFELRDCVFADLHWSVEGNPLYLVLEQYRPQTTRMSSITYCVSAVKHWRSPTITELTRLLPELEVTDSQHELVRKTFWGRMAHFYTIYLAIIPTDGDSHAAPRNSLLYEPRDLSFASPVRLPSRTRLKLFGRDIGAELLYEPSAGTSPTGDPRVMTVWYKLWYSDSYLALRAGRCRCTPTTDPDVFWANLAFTKTMEGLMYMLDRHDCSKDHILLWRNMERQCMMLLPRRRTPTTVTAVPLLHPRDTTGQTFPSDRTRLKEARAMMRKDFLVLDIKLRYRPWKPNPNVLDIYFPKAPAYHLPRCRNLRREPSSEILEETTPPTAVVRRHCFPIQWCMRVLNVVRRSSSESPQIVQGRVRKGCRMILTLTWRK